MMENHCDIALNKAIKALAKKHNLPLSFCNDLIFTEIREGVPDDDALEWLDKILPAFMGRVRPHNV